MDREEFETYLNANSRAVALFRSRILSYQDSKNRQRAASKRWIIIPGNRTHFQHLS